jgi:hypothetical protein
MSIILPSKTLRDQKPFSEFFLGDSKSGERVVRSFREVGPTCGTLSTFNGCEEQNSLHNLIITELLLKRSLQSTLCNEQARPRLHSKSLHKNIAVLLPLCPTADLLMYTDTHYEM